MYFLPNVEGDYRGPAVSWSLPLTQHSPTHQSLHTGYLPIQLNHGRGWTREENKYWGQREGALATLKKSSQEAEGWWLMVQNAVTICSGIKLNHAPKLNLAMASTKPTQSQGFVLCRIFDLTLTWILCSIRLGSSRHTLGNRKQSENCRELGCAELLELKMAGTLKIMTTIGHNKTVNLRAALGQQQLKMQWNSL